MTVHFPFDNSYARLPDRFFTRTPPTPVAAPRLVRLNRGLAVELGLDPDWLAGPEGVAALGGAAVPERAEPIAVAYAGHQFGHFQPQLGDGRAVLLGTFFGLIVMVFAIILLVSQCGTGDDDEVYDDDIQGVAVVVDEPLPALAPA